MNDYMIYNLAKQRHADLILDELHRSRARTSLGHRGSWVRVAASAQQRFAVLARRSFA
ncbi:hypothetical protein ABN028_08880 [Actinopolymorpha sp. B17G11]|uniref:hypothetical protein n=1 Tax=Actinopolymorpha sp. B17G11 TaxID=3160861 RepID=UPI0032E3F719